MNQFFIQTQSLLTGQAAPFTGSAVNIARSKEAAFTAYASGLGGSINLQYKSPFFENDWVGFYSFAGMQTGYAAPAYLTTPMTEVRAVASGTGVFWCSFTSQN